MGQRKSHDFECRFKRIKCKDCGEAILRKEMPGHMRAACPKRGATCLFGRIGCNVELTCETLGPHLEECHTSHLMLLLARMDEQQETIDNLAADITADKASMAELREADRRQMGELAIQVGTLRNKVERNGDVGSSLNRMQTEIKRLESKMSRLQN